MYWVLTVVWVPDSSHKIGNKFFIRHCQCWKEGSFVCETVWFFCGWILIRLNWNFSRFFPNSVEILGWNFRKKTIPGEFFRNFVQTKVIVYRNLWNSGLLSAISLWGPYCAEKNSHKHFRMLFAPRQGGTSINESLKKDTRKKMQEVLFSEKSVFFTLGLGLTTSYSLGILVWNF